MLFENAAVLLKCICHTLMPHCRRNLHPKFQSLTKGQNFRETLPGFIRSIADTNQVVKPEGFKGIADLPGPLISDEDYAHCTKISKTARFDYSRLDDKTVFWDGHVKRDDRKTT